MLKLIFLYVAIGLVVSVLRASVIGPKIKAGWSQPAEILRIFVLDVLGWPKHLWKMVKKDGGKKKDEETA